MFKTIQLKKGQNIWLTADTHFAHLNIIKKLSKWKDKSGCRNFETMEDHDHTIIDNINKLVKPNDILFHMGDWSFGDPDNVRKYRNRIACQNINLILGNHDKYIEPKDSPYRGCFTSVEYIAGFSLKIDGQPFKTKFFLSHYSHQVWPSSHHGTMHCFGHSHHSIEGIGRSMDVGVDCNNFYPFNIDEIIYQLKDVEPAILDHHTGGSNE